MKINKVVLLAVFINLILLPKKNFSEIFFNKKIENFYNIKEKNFYKLKNIIQLKKQYINNFKRKIFLKKNNKTIQLNLISLNIKKKYLLNKKYKNIISFFRNTKYIDNNIILNFQKAILNHKNLFFFKNKYYLKYYKIYGKTEKIFFYKKHDYIIFKNNSISFCCPNDNTWSILSRELILNKKKKIINIWNTSFKIKNFSILKLPYIYLPFYKKNYFIFLLPKFKYQNTFNFIQPFNYNFSKNIKFFLNSEYIHKSGVMYKNTLQYFNRIKYGNITFNYLLSDKKLKNFFNTTKNTNRWTINSLYNGFYKKYWNFNFYYYKVSDFNYFKDFNILNINYLIKKFNLKFFKKNWQMNIFSKKNKIIFIKDIYNIHSKLNFKYIYNKLYPLNISLYLENTKFINTNINKPHANRFHFESFINFPISIGIKKNINLETKIFITHYQQNNITYYNKYIDKNKYHQLKPYVSRIIPQFKINGEWTFYKKYNLYKSFYFYMLNPKIQYLFRPFKKQNNIYHYDTVILNTDYKNLFRNSIYSNIDKINQENKFTIQFISSIYKNNLNKIFNFSLGKNYFLKKIFLNNNNYEYLQPMFFGDIFWKIGSRWNFYGNVQFHNLKEKYINIKNLKIKYSNNINNTIQLYYRYSNLRNNFLKKNIIKSIAYHEFNYPKIGININILAFNKISFFSHYSYNFDLKKSIEKIFGLQYKTSCYQIKFGYEKKINYLNNNNKYSNQFFFSITLQNNNHYDI